MTFARIESNTTARTELCEIMTTSKGQSRKPLDTYFKSHWFMHLTEIKPKTIDSPQATKCQVAKDNFG